MISELTAIVMWASVLGRGCCGADVASMVPAERRPLASGTGLVIGERVTIWGR